MKTAVPLALLALFFGGMLQGCSKSNPTGPSSGGDLLANPSFELNGSPSLQDWTQAYTDTSVHFFSSDVPPDGGRYSIVIDAVWGPPYTVSQAVPADAGNHRYEFSAWAKRSGFGGQMRISLQRSDSTYFEKTMNIVDTAWTQYSIIDTVTAESGDSVVVSVTGGFSQLLFGQTYFDDCDLERID
jgi:hypothetical protein